MARGYLKSNSKTGNYIEIAIIYRKTQVSEKLDIFKVRKTQKILSIIDYGNLISIQQDVASHY